MAVMVGKNTINLKELH